MLREGIYTGIYTFASSDRTGPRKKKIRGKVVAPLVWVSLFEINLKEIFNTLMTIARVKLLMLLVRVILPKTALVLWILKFNINVRVMPTIHTSLCPIFVYIPTNYRSMIFFLFILTTKYFRQQPDSLRNLIDMFFFFYFRSILKCLSNIGRIVWMLRSLCSKALFARQRFVPIKCARRWKNRCIVCVNTILDR